MEVLEAVLYFILTLILLALIGVLSWLIYDYFEYKKVVKGKITDTVAQSDESNSLLKKVITTDYEKKFDYTSNYVLDSKNYLLSDYDKKFSNTSNYIAGTSNYMISDYDKKFSNSSNYIAGTSNYLKTEYSTMFDNSSANLNKFFSFGIHNDNSKINDKLHKRTWDLDTEIQNLELIKNTIAKSNLTAENLLTAKKGVKVQTNAGTAGPSSSTNYKGLELCNTSGEQCWNLYVDSLGDLRAAKPNDVTYSLSFTALATSPATAAATTAATVPATTTVIATAPATAAATAPATTTVTAPVLATVPATAAATVPATTTTVAPATTVTAAPATTPATTAATATTAAPAITSTRAI